MPIRRRSAALKQKLAQPTAEVGLFERFLLWAFRGDIRSIFAIGILFTVGMSIQHLMPTGFTNVLGAVKVTSAFLIFGIFLGVIVVTEDNKRFTASGAWIRTIYGALAFAAIALILSASWGAVALAALIGIILGYTGIHWARHI
jgi:hypothetical protein